ncbi:hypothetical protein AB0I28_15725 [Phytomonospora sp. NPDC050363]|uniref:hypothetical protein n=1 Tax=Phytomonospora sp. NPDC050363 TaxID=3155642 RepID=UPI0033FAA6E5
MWRRPGWVAALLALVTATPAVVLAAGVRQWWWLGSAAALAALATVPAALALERAKRASERREPREREPFRAPLVSDMKEPVLLGVHPARPHPAGPPPYIPRDFDGELRAALAEGGFVLLTGDSTAGKSRSAYEAVRAVLPGHRLIVPENPAALPAALAETRRHDAAVLWLDELQRFIGENGLSAAQVEELLSVEGHRAVVATIGAGQMQALREAPLPEWEPRVLLSRPREIVVARAFSAAERARAEARRADERIAEALDAPDTGVTEYLAAGPDALRLWRGAWAEGWHPRAAALVAAAVDCRRTGSFRLGVPRRLVEDLHADYLASRGGARLRPESLEEAWAWLAEPVKSTAYLLWRDPAEPDVCHPFDYLVDEARRTQSRLSDDFYRRIIEYPPPVHRAGLAVVLTVERRLELLAEVLRGFRDRHEELGEGTFALMSLVVCMWLEEQGRDEECYDLANSVWTVLGDENEKTAVMRLVSRVLACGALSRSGREVALGRLALEVVRHPLAGRFGLTPPHE